MENWTQVCALEDIPRLGSRVLLHRDPDEGEIAIALFRTQGEVFALRNRCPHRGGPLADGIVHDRHVSCPLHGLKLNLASGEAVAPDTGCVRTYPVRVEQGLVHLRLG